MRRGEFRTKISRRDKKYHSIRKPKGTFSDIESISRATHAGRGVPKEKLDFFRFLEDQK